MSYAANVDEPPHGPWCAGTYRYAYPRFHPGWIVLMVLGFLFWWPIGLAMLAVILWRKGMGCWSHDRWHHKMQRMETKMDHLRGRVERWGRAWGEPPSSGNAAFDEYRTDTLRRLEDEEREFRDFLERLRAAKDKSEFDQFMADRRNRPTTPPPQA
jgi:hypothetical protein